MLVLAAAGVEPVSLGARSLHMSAIPDALYMVAEERHRSSSPYATTPISTVDIIAGSIPVPDQATFKIMMQRMQDLKRSAAFHHTLSLAYVNHTAVLHQLHLQVVREAGLPDAATEALRNSHFYYPSMSGYIPEDTGRTERQARFRFPGMQHDACLRLFLSCLPGNKHESKKDASQLFGRCSRYRVGNDSLASWYCAKDVDVVHGGRDEDLIVPRNLEHLDLTSGVGISQDSRYPQMC